FCVMSLPAHYGVTHGMALVSLLPPVIRFNTPIAGPLYVELAHEAWHLNGDLNVAAESLTRRIMELMQLGGLPTTLSACGIGRGILPVLADEAAQQWTGRFNPRPVTEADLLQLYEEAF